MADSTIKKYILTKVSGSASAALAAASRAAALASQIAAAASAAAALVSQTAAAASATNAASSAANAASSAANAASSAAASESSKNAAQAQAVSAAASANIATLKANDAINASVVAGEAVTDAEAAANAANAALTAAAGIYDAFDDRYLGAKSAPPALDNDGNAIIVGALYFDTTLNEWRIWNGGGWQAAPFSIPGALMTSNHLSDVVNKAAARQNLGLEIDVNVQAFDADLAAIAVLATTHFGRSLLTLLNADTLAALTQTQLDARYARPAQIPNPPLGWYGIKDVGDGSLVIETVSPFDAAAYSLDRWGMKYMDKSLALGLVIGLNINSSVSGSNVEFSYTTSPDAVSPTPIAWGFRDAGNGELFFEVVNPAGGENVPDAGWNMGFVGGGTAWGQQSLFELFTVPDKDIVLNY